MSIADGELTSMALCWRLERCDGAGIALTSHDEALIRSDVTYEAAPAMLPASVTRGLGLDPAAGEINGALDSASLSDADLSLGRWDGAAMELRLFDWADADRESVRLLAGEIGSVAIDGDSFSADLQGAAARLNGAVCPATSAECRAEFGDKLCRVDLASRSVRAVVTASVGAAVTINRTVDDRFVLGRLRYMSGPNCGLSTIVLAASGSTVHVRDLPRAPIDAGCVIELREGCDKRFQTCSSRFGNAVNFRGEPHLPGNDLLTRYPGA